MRARARDRYKPTPSGRGVQKSKEVAGAPVQVSASQQPLRASRRNQYDDAVARHWQA